MTVDSTDSSMLKISFDADGKMVLRLNWDYLLTRCETRTLQDIQLRLTDEIAHRRAKVTP